MAPKILLRFAAILLLATTVMTRFEQARAQDDPCIEVNEACNAVCTTAVVAFERASCDPSILQSSVAQQSSFLLRFTIV